MSCSCLPLGRVEFPRTARTLPLQQSPLTVSVPMFDPQRDGGAMDLKRLRDLPRGMSFDAQRNGMKSLGHARLLVLDRFFTELEQQLDASLVAFGKIQGA